MITAEGPGLIAAGHTATADAAAVMLAAGGSAFDAVVAAGFASAVCEPGFTSLAGGGFALTRTASGDETLFDFFVDMPGLGRSGPAVDPVFDEVSVRFAAAEQTFHCGPGSVAVPGVLAGYLHLHAKLGRLPLATVVAPAIALASGGVQVTETQAADFALLEPILSRTQASRDIFFPHGRLLGQGDTLSNPDLARFLSNLADDPSNTFYQGHRAQALVAQLAAGGGLLTVADLVSYQVIERAPLRVRYRDHQISTNPPPTFGGTLLGLALKRLEATPLGEMANAEVALALIDVMAGIDADRHQGHPDVIAALRGELDDDPRARRLQTRGTTHVTVADAEGNVAAMTTSNGECSGDIIDGTGIACNNMLGEDDLHPDGFHAGTAGERVASMMSPTFVTDQAGQLCLALGSGGSKRIRSALLQVLVAVLDQGADLQDAVDAPRLHWDRDHIEIEPGLDVSVTDALKSHHSLNVWPNTSMYFGGVHAVIPGSKAAGDARRGGATRSVPAP